MGRHPYRTGCGFVVPERMPIYPILSNDPAEAHVRGCRGQADWGDT